MRISLSFLALSLCAIGFAACTESTAPTSDTLGKPSIEAIQQNTANVWFETGYSAFPGPNAADIARFEANVDRIKASYDPAQHDVTMVVKLNCGCSETQNTLPQVIKTLDAAGVPREKMNIFTTDTRLNGIDSVKAKFGIKAAPTYIIERNKAVKGQIIKAATSGKTIDQELADFFAVP